MIITKYKNGNTLVTIRDNGTKIRRYEGKPMPEYPESIDLKITDFCNYNCNFCYENSSVNGKHAYFSTIRNILNQLNKGTEIALGGGDPIQHPEIYRIASLARHMGLLPSITVNGNFFKYAEDVPFLTQDFDDFFGVGVSHTTAFLNNVNLISDTLKRKIVVHVIHGITDYEVIEYYVEKGYKILILGFKNMGRATKLTPKFDTLFGNLENLIKLNKSTISFDNLSIEQLELSKRIKEYDSMYMGDDGEFTMFIDAVENTYAKSSVCKRKPLNCSVKEAFKNL